MNLAERGDDISSASETDEMTWRCMPPPSREVRPPRAVMRGAADNHIIPQTIKRKRRGRIPCLDYSPARLRADHGRSLSFLLLGAPRRQAPVNQWRTLGAHPYCTPNCNHRGPLT